MADVVTSVLDTSELTEISGQTGSGVIELSNGAVVQVMGKLDALKLKQVYNLIKTASDGVLEEPLKKVTVKFDACTYVALFDEAFIYVSLLEPVS